MRSDREVTHEQKLWQIREIAQPSLTDWPNAVMSATNEKGART